MKKYIATIIYLGIAAISYALSFSVYPTGFNIDSTRVTTEEIMIVNNTLEPLRVEIFPEADKDFSEEHSLNSNIKLFPKSISIKPGATQTVRFRVKPESKLQDGEYRSYITFKEIPYEIKNTSSNEKKAEGLVANLKLNTEVSIPVLSMGKNVVVDGELNNLKYKYSGSEFSIEADVTSKGNAAVYYYFDLKISGEEEISKERIGYSKRSGKSKISSGITLKNNLKGKRASLKIYDQTGKIYYNKNITL